MELDTAHIQRINCLYFPVVARRRPETLMQDVRPQHGVGRLQKRLCATNPMCSSVSMCVVGWAKASDEPTFRTSVQVHHDVPSISECKIASLAVLISECKIASLSECKVMGLALQITAEHARTRPAVYFGELAHVGPGLGALGQLRQGVGREQVADDDRPRLAVAAVRSLSRGELGLGRGTVHIDI